MKNKASIGQRVQGQQISRQAVTARPANGIIPNPQSLSGMRPACSQPYSARFLVSQAAAPRELFAWHVVGIRQFSTPLESHQLGQASRNLPFVRSTLHRS